MEQKSKANVRIVIVEDEKEQAELLRNYLARYSRETGIVFDVSEYENAMDFLSSYGSGADIVLMDIELPGMDGMAAAARLRERDKSVVIIFVTNMAQFAVNGYKVGALDFLVKPVTYAEFSATMAAAADSLSSGDGEAIAVTAADNVISVQVKSLKYIEVMKHRLTFHTTDGNIISRGTLGEWESRLARYDFVKCNSCYLVNLRYVRSVSPDETNVGGDVLRVSQSRRKAYRAAVIAYIGGTNV
ncbi:MAG TPA: LytTR family DNA-binding domain-containing protein [Firmicutes bacterium]|nr:LytTR family DNA-binding domain-containing protein [Bacillota bacterium]